MRIQTIIFVIPALIATLIFTLMDASASEPAELNDLMSTYSQQLDGAASVADKQQVLQEYVRELTSLESNFRSNMRDRASVNAVRKEIRKTNKKLSSVGLGESESSQPVITKKESVGNEFDPNELIDLRNTFESQKGAISGRIARGDVFNEYIQELTSLENNLRSNMRGRQSINAVRREIRKIKLELSSPPTGTPTPVSEPVVAQVEKIQPESQPESPVAKEAVPKPAKVQEPQIATVEKQPEITPVVDTPKPPAVSSSKPTVAERPVITPISIPNITPVITAVAPVVEASPVKSKDKPMKESKPPAVKTSSAMKAEKVTPAVQTIKPVSKPKPPAVEKAVTNKLAGKAVEPKFKPAAPKPMSVQKPKTTKAQATKAAAAGASNSAAVRQAARPEPKNVKPLTFKPAAPKPAVSGVSAKSAIKTKPVKVAKAQTPVKPKPVPLKISSKKETEKPAKIEPASASKPVAIAKPQRKKRGRVYVVESMGIAGSRSIRQDNVYTFNIVKPGKQSTLTFYAAGQKSNDTYGKIWLINPNEQPVEIGKWKDSDFSKPADTVKSYKEITPVEIDISKHVKKPGSYKVDFDWTDFGKEPLVILRVEINS